MSPKRIDREYRKQLSDNTSARSKGVTTGTDVNGSSGHKNLKRRKKDIAFTGKEEPAQNEKHLIAMLRNVPTNNSSMNNMQQINLCQSLSDDKRYLNSDSKNTKGSDEFVNSSCANLYSNKTLEKPKLLKQWSGKTRMNLYASKSLGSPIIKNVTPYKHKIPKKSPVSVPSAKAHPIRSSKVFRTRKRLTLTENSLSEFQGNKKLPNNNKMQLKLHVSDTDLSTSCSLSNRYTSTFATKETSRSTSMPSVGVKYSTRRFSKPTKIVSRSPKLKLRSKKSKASTIECFPYANTKLKQPIVLLQRLPNIVTIMPSSLPVSSSMVKIRINDRFGDNNINVSRKIFNFAFDHPRQLLKMSNKPGKRHTRSKNYSNDEQNETLYKLQENTGTRLREKSLSGKMMLMHECGDACQTSSGSLISSTPKDKEILNEPGKKCKRRKMSPEWDTTSKLNKCSTRSSQNDNVTVTMEDEQEGVKIKNETYELIEPKTPNLRKRLQEKRDVEENNLNQKSAKKNVKIRFTSSSSNRNSNYNTRSGGRLNKKDRSDDDLKNITSTASLKKNILKSRISVFRRRSRSNSNQVIPTVDSFTPSQIGRKSTTSVVNVNIATPPQQFMSRQNTKWPSATKKVPNFANIHNKIFTKSESIVDAKNRLKDRHTAFTTSRINKSTKGEINLNEEGDQLSKGSNKETYNRFGFKMRKRKATDCILRNSSSHSARCKEQCRAILKGVRTNRRFELQMKLRNVNL